MLIEYKIKFEDDGVTISQRVEPNAVDGVSLPEVTQNSGLPGKTLGSFFAAGAGSGGSDPIGPGGEGSDPIGPGGHGQGRQPIVILGPIVVGAPAREQTQDGKVSQREKHLSRPGKE